MAATCPAKTVLMAVAMTVALLLMVQTERVVVCRHRSSAVQTTYFQLAVQISTVVAANTRDSDAVQITAPLLVVQTTRAAVASIHLMVAVLTASPRPQDQITRAVRVIRISLVAALMVSPSLKDLMDKVIMSKTEIMLILVYI